LVQFLAAALLLFFIYLFLKKAGPGSRARMSTYFMALCATALTVAIIRYPKEAFEASVSGLEVWWHVVFPALLPFFIFSKVLIGLGVVHLMGVFLEPVMRPVFNVPGAGSFVMAMGLASGYPIGAILTTELRTRNLCSRVEAERLLSFSNTADPLFMSGAVAVGMLGYPAAGLTIALAHYLSSLTLGVLMRFYKFRESSYDRSYPPGKNIVRRALEALVEARNKDGRPLGKLMGDAIRESMETLLLIGGFIILFSVIIRILEIAGATGCLAEGLARLLHLAGLDPQLAPALISGFFEIDVGCQHTAEAAALLQQKVIACGMIIAWSGLSVHAQVASIIAKTDIKIAPYIFARGLHAVLAGLYTTLLLGPAGKRLADAAIPAFFSTVPRSSISFWWLRTATMLNRSLVLLGCLLAVSLAVYLVRRLKMIFFYNRSC
jgi:sporulation integral membrane protein YlbJ